jgi:LytS/YehU family sensor histidine kinase
MLNLLDYIIVISILIIGGLCVLIFFQNKKQNELKAENNRLRKEFDQLSQQVIDPEFEHTKFILNPHLFKNTLNSIQGYAFRTHQALEKLGGVLDYVLYDSNSQLISLEQELAFARNFIELNKIKLLPVYDIRIKEEVDSENGLYGEKLVIPLITAYFIENAFKHADLQSHDAFISIDFEFKNNAFIFTVSNKINKKPLLSPKSGIGKENMKRRLDLIYKGDYKLEYITEGDTYTSYLNINLLEQKNKMYNTR